jgi:adenine-specific DNA-methyltransferase
VPSYLQMMYERLALARELLADSGSIYVHCDWHMNAGLRMILDELYGSDHFLNEVVWKRTTAHGDAAQGARRFDVVHDTVLLYVKNPDRYKWTTQYIPFGEAQIEQQYNKIENGRRYRLVTPTARKPGGDTSYELARRSPAGARLS